MYHFINHHDLILKIYAKWIYKTKSLILLILESWLALCAEHRTQNTEHSWTLTITVNRSRCRRSTKNSEAIFTDRANLTKIWKYSNHCLTWRVNNAIRNIHSLTNFDAAVEFKFIPRYWNWFADNLAVNGHLNHRFYLILISE